VQKDNTEGYAWGIVAALGLSILLGVQQPPWAGMWLIVLAVLRGMLRVIRFYQRKADAVLAKLQVAVEEEK
jgi:hypothetical protein